MNDIMIVKKHSKHILSEYEERKTSWKRLLITVFFSACIIVSISTAVKVDTKKVAAPSKGLPKSVSNSMLSEELNRYETELLTLMSHTVGATDLVEQGTDTYAIYINHLYQYLSESDVNLSLSQYKRIKKEVNHLYNIFQKEGTKHLMQMSIDGRTAARYLLEEIYQECDLSISFDGDNSIQCIQDYRNNILYGDETIAMQKGFNVNGAIMIGIILVVMIGICYLISHKNNLFIKDVVYDGFEEKRFA
jgi:hypothetical protein